jgi:hypothetical protein
MKSFFKVKVKYQQLSIHIMSNMTKNNLSQYSSFRRLVTKKINQWIAPDVMRILHNPSHQPFVPILLDECLDYLLSTPYPIIIPNWLVRACIVKAVRYTIGADFKQSLASMSPHYVKPVQPTETAAQTSIQKPVPVKLIQTSIQKPQKVVFAPATPTYITLYVAKKRAQLAALSEAKKRNICKQFNLKYNTIKQKKNV